MSGDRFPVCRHKARWIFPGICPLKGAVAAPKGALILPGVGDLVGACCTDHVIPPSRLWAGVGVDLKRRELVSLSPEEVSSSGGGERHHETEFAGHVVRQV